MIPNSAHRTRFAAVALLAAAALGLTACSGGQSPAAAGDVATLDGGVSTSIDSAVESAMQQSGSTEAIVGVWSGDDAYIRGFGDGVDAKTRIRGAQATQPVVCALLLDLVDQGRVELDRKVSRDLTRQTDIDDVTYGQLCNMRSGLADYKSAFTDIFTNNPTRPWPEQELLAQGLVDSPLSWPGLDVHVADTGPLLLARALKVKTGTEVADLLSEHVYGKADMRSSYYPALASTEVQGDALNGLTYRSEGGAPVCDAGPVEVPEVSPSMLSGAGGTVTTVTDLKNFYSHYLDGTFGGDAASVITEAAPVTNPERNADGEPTSEPAEGTQWAFGMEKTGPLYGNAGAITGTLTAAYHDPESDFTVVVALNNSSAGASFAQALAFQLTALASAGGVGPEITWTAEYQAARLADKAVCQ